MNLHFLKLTSLILTFLLLQIIYFNYYYSNCEKYFIYILKFTIVIVIDFLFNLLLLIIFNIKHCLGLLNSNLQFTIFILRMLFNHWKIVNLAIYFNNLEKHSIKILMTVDSN